jgi:hypothetical protein
MQLQKKLFAALKFGYDKKENKRREVGMQMSQMQFEETD